MSGSTRELLVAGIALAAMEANRAGRGVTGGGDQLIIDCPAGLEAIAQWLEAAGWRPPAQAITDPAELDALPERTAIVIGGYVFQWFGGWWNGSGGVMPMHSAQLCLAMHEGEAATVVWSPTEKAGTE